MAETSPGAGMVDTPPVPGSLPEPAVVKGHVRDQNGQPVREGEVYVALVQRVCGHARVAADGSFVVTASAPPSGSTENAVVSVLGNGWVIRQVVRLTAGKTYELNLERKQLPQVTVTVLGVDGQVAPDALVAFTASPIDVDWVRDFDAMGGLDFENALLWWSNPLVARTDGSGRAKIDVEQSRYALPMSRDLVLTASSTPISRETHEATITLHRAWGVQLDLVDADARAPVDRAVAILQLGSDDGKTRVPWILAASKGRVVLRRPLDEEGVHLPAVIHVTVNGGSHVPATFDVQLDSTAPFAARAVPLVPLGPSNAAELILETPWTADCSLRLVRSWRTPGGSTLMGWSVECLAPDRWRTWLLPGAQSLSARPDIEYASELSWSGEFDVRAGEKRTVKVTLPPFGRLQLSVRPAPLQPVELTAEVRSVEGRFLWREEQRWIDSSGLTLPFVPVGSWILRVGPEGATHDHPFVVVDGRDAKVVVDASEFGR